MAEPEAVSLLAEGLAEWSIELTEGQAEQFGEYARLLVDWNQTRMNLTRLTSPRDIAIFHFLDSLALLQVANVPGNSSLLDIGTGAGFPGLPLKILRPDLKITLLEGTAKKLSFCREVVRLLQLGAVEIIHGRAEEMEGRLEGRFDFVAARAVAPLRQLLAWSAPYLKPAGLFVAWKGARAEEEVAQAGREARSLGLVLRIEKLLLPGSGVPQVQRAYVICRRIGAFEAGALPSGAT